MLARLDRPAPPALAGLVARGGSIGIPAGDRERFLRDWYPGLPSGNPSTTAFRGMPAVVASTLGGGGYAPAPNTAIMGGAPQLPNAQSYPVRDPLLFGQPLPPVQRSASQ